MANFSLYLPDDVKKRLDKLAEQTGESRNKIITTAVEEYLKKEIVREG